MHRIVDLRVAVRLTGDSGNYITVVAESDHKLY